MMRIRTSSEIQGTQTPKSQDSVSRSFAPRPLVTSVPTSLDAKAIAAETDKIDSDCQKLEKKKTALTPSKKYSEQAKCFLDSAAELKKYKREHPILSKIASFLPKLPWGGEFFKHTEIANKAATDQDVLVNAALKTKDASPLAYSVICQELAALKSKSELELTYEIDSKNPATDEHDFLLRQTLHLDHLERIHEKDREKAELIRRYKNLLKFKLIFENRLNTVTQKQLKQETTQAAEAFKSILERPKARKT